MLLLPALPIPAQQPGKQLTLKECYQLAKQGNTLVQQAQRSLQAREDALQAEDRSHYPKLDLLAGYK